MSIPGLVPVRPLGPRRLWHILSIGIVGTVVAAGGTAAGRPLVFQPPVLFGAGGSEPKKIIPADFNNDGHLDLLVSVTVGGGVSALYGDGAGGFADHPIQTGMAAWGLAVADFNSDGKMDFVVTNGEHFSGSVALYSGDGAEGFSRRQTINGGGQFPVGIIVADFNEDGRPDLAVANNVLNGLTICLRNSDGTFADGVAAPGSEGLDATDIAAGDLNADGHIDLAVPSYSGVWIYTGAGDGTFTYTGGAGLSSINDAAVITDLDSDGRADVASVDYYGDLALVNLGAGGGGFAPTQQHGVGQLPSDIKVADLDKDGHADLVISDLSSNSISILMGTGGGAFAEPQSIGVGFQPEAVAIGDYNEDGWLDIAVALRNFGDQTQVAVLLRVPPSPCNGDANADGAVTFADMTSVLGHWGAVYASAPGGSGAGDANRDGLVNFADVSAVLANWGAACP